MYRKKAGAWTVAVVLAGAMFVGAAAPVASAFAWGRSAWPSYDFWRQPSYDSQQPRYDQPRDSYRYGRYGGSQDGAGNDTGNNSQHGTPDVSPEAPAASRTIESVIDAGMNYLGTPYEFGSNRSNTKTFDCSDFVRQAFKEGAGITLPTDSRKQGAYVRDNGPVKTSWRELKRGDLMFFMAYQGSDADDYRGVNPLKERITHVALYLGNGKMLHTYSNESGGVHVGSIDQGAWSERFLFGGGAL